MTWLTVLTGGFDWVFGKVLLLSSSYLVKYPLTNADMLFSSANGNLLNLPEFTTNICSVCIESMEQFYKRYFEISG